MVFLIISYIETTYLILCYDKNMIKQFRNGVIYMSLQQHNTLISEENLSKVTGGSLLNLYY